MSEYRDWSTIPTDTPMSADEWVDLLYDIERSEPDSDKRSAAYSAVAERLAKLERAVAVLEKGGRS